MVLFSCGSAAGLADVAREKRRGGRCCKADQTATCETYHPGQWLRCAAGPIECRTKSDRPEEAATKAYTGIERHSRARVASRRDGQQARRQVGEIALHDETRAEREPYHHHIRKRGGQSDEPGYDGGCKKYNASQLAE